MLSVEEEIVFGGVDYTNEVRAYLETKHHTELANAEIEQKKLMQAERRVSGGVRKNLPFGRLRMKVCQEVFHFWGSKLGYECWKDDTFKKDMERRFGDLIQIKSSSGNIVV